jgi:CHAT domain-containing protein
MKRFYAAMLRDKKTPAAALREAQLGMMKIRRWQSPQYWAGFALQGDWR